jgi:hypothetical protein
MGLVMSLQSDATGHPVYKGILARRSGGKVRYRRRKPKDVIFRKRRILSTTSATVF